MSMRQGVTLRSTSTSRKIRASRCRISNSNSSRHYASRRVRMRPQSAATTPGGLEVGSEESVDQIKLKLLKLAAATDRGQLLFQQKVYDLDKYNSDSFDEIQNLVAKLREKQIESDNKGSDDDLSLHDGKWELVLATAQVRNSLSLCLSLSSSSSSSSSCFDWFADLCSDYLEKQQQLFSAFSLFSFLHRNFRSHGRLHLACPVVGPFDCSAVWHALLQATRAASDVLGCVDNWEGDADC